MKDDCIFCKLANGIYATSTVYEDGDFRAIIDIEPAAFGHVLLLPKQHMADLLSIEPAVGEKALLLASRIACAMKEALGCSGVNLLQNSGSTAWQTIYHLHFHLIPRFENDELRIPWKKLSYAEGEAQLYADKIAACIRSHSNE